MLQADQDGMCWEGDAADQEQRDMRLALLLQQGELSRSQRAAAAVSGLARSERSANHPA